MAASQPAGLFLSRELTRIIPFTAQKTFVSAAAGAGATFVAEFDVARATTDRNQLLGGAFPSGAQPQQAIGPLLDAVCFDNGVGGASILVEYAVDRSAVYRAFATTGVPQNTLTNIAGLRVTARFVRVTFTNVTAASVLEAGVWIRSS
jgi:hypothetical protein